MISVKCTSKNSQNTDNFLNNIIHKAYLKKLSFYGQKGVDALSEATPKRTGETASSWKYSIEERPGEIRIVWSNTKTTRDGIPVVVLLHYGHGTKNGSFVEGIDFINPSMAPIFDELAKDAWEVITK